MRTTDNLTPDIEAEVDRLRREQGLGTSEAVVLLARRGLNAGVPSSRFTQRTARLGARVVFADIDDTLCLDPVAALSACSDRTKAIVTVNMFGYPAALPIGAPCPLVEDSAHSLS